ncbi:hypothetical protein H4219_002243 [Mycoemilia scoparia]|uniref:RING-type E3 ubiquitin transferase n=1 Tax=Mycoemilia scoparia TaxID=417184 RepID=A0A9W8DPB9_9FUNG|nr:hypothetical protein H4219_002243 [Mycoemilia scoparia]
MVLGNMFLLLTILFCKLMMKIFFGSLRVIEVEHLYERGWFAVTETCLALTVFREEFNIFTMQMFVALVVTKIFHWIIEDRVDFMEQQLSLNKLMVARLSALSLILFGFDSAMIGYSVRVTRIRGPTIMIMFGFEYALLTVNLLGSVIKCILNIVEARFDHEWEEKSTYVFHLEIFCDFVKFILYVTFFVTLVSMGVIPIHIIRDMYITTKSFVNKCRDWIRYRQAIYNMNRKYQTISQEELDQLNDPTCIICREDMQGPPQETVLRWREQQQNGGGHVDVPGSTPKKLPCGHIFHFNCLRGWLERQQACPTCRRSVLAEPLGTASAGPNQLGVQNERRSQHESTNAGSSIDASSNNNADGTSVDQLGRNMSISSNTGAAEGAASSNGSNNSNNVINRNTTSVPGPAASTSASGNNNINNNGALNVDGATRILDGQRDNNGTGRSQAPVGINLPNLYTYGFNGTGNGNGVTPTTNPTSLANSGTTTPAPQHHPALRPNAMQSTMSGTLGPTFTPSASGQIPTFSSIQNGGQGQTAAGPAFAVAENPSSCKPHQNMHNHNLTTPQPFSSIPGLIPGARLIPLFPQAVANNPENGSQSQNAENSLGTTMPSAGDQFIDSAQQQQQQQHYQSHSNTIQSFPLPDLSKLSDEQIRILESNSRRAIEERLRTLAIVQRQLENTAQYLMQLQSIITPQHPGISDDDSSSSIKKSNGINSESHHKQQENTEKSPSTTASTNANFEEHGKSKEINDTSISEKSVLKDYKGKQTDMNMHSGDLIDLE